MRTMPAKAAKDGFGLLLDTAQREPVAITRKGRKVAVVLSSEVYERLEALEDSYWGRLAETAREEGSLGVEESERRVKSYLADAAG